VVDSVDGRAGQQARSSNRDDYTRDRFRWLDQVASDPDLPASAFKVAYAIATELKRNSGTTTLVSETADTTDNIRELWLGIREIAAKIAMSVATVADMVRRLEQRGHIQMTPGKRGRGHSHHYRLVEKVQPTEQLKVQPAEHYKKPKVQQTELFGQEKFSRPDTKVQPAEQNPFVPLKEIPIGEIDSPVVASDCDHGRRQVGKQHDDIEAHFETWYAQYPKRAAKAAALKAYRAVITKKLATPEALMAGAMRYAAERSGQDPKYTKHPATWLNAGCWADELSTPIGNTIDPDGNPVRPPPNRQSNSSNSWLAAGMAGMRRPQ
jgi:DNA-binding MarR family transcriptional regulator